MTKNRVRVAFTMRRSDYDDLKALAVAEDETVTGYLRRAVATHRYLRERAASGGTILVEENGIQAEVVFR